MSHIIDGLLKLDFTTNNHSIIYAPNSTGKTRLTKILLKKYENEPSMFFTSSEIINMLSFSGRKIFVGSDSSKKLDNENIVKDINKTGYGDEILQLYNAKNASNLSKGSFLFKEVGLKKKDSFEIYTKLITKISGKTVPELKFKLHEHELVEIDKLLSSINLSEIKRIASESILLSLKKNALTISQELKEKLKDIASSLSSSQNYCPLCGQQYMTNNELRATIEKTLKEYVIDSTAKDYELCAQFFNALNDINTKLGLDIFKCYYESNISADLLIDNVSIAENCIEILCFLLVEKGESYFSKEQYNRYLNNKSVIEKENNARENNLTFYSNVVDILNKLITLPDGFCFKQNGEKIEILDPSNKIIDAEDFLSESEQKRMCISIVFAEIRQRGLQYVIFDDPVDSNDDYYFDVSVNVIGDLLLNESSINWIILTHEFRMVSILSERCRTSYNQPKPTVSFLFYLPDPSFSGSGIPPFSLITMSYNNLGFLLEHETIIFKKIFTGQVGYQCDKELALLSSFNTARNLYNDILNDHSISKHKRSKLANTISTGNKSYEHYKNGKKRIMRLSTLSIMNKTMYESCSSFYYSNSKVYAANYRVKYVNTTNFSSIKSDNEILKYILFTMTRVMNLHYLFEKKLAIWSSSMITSFSFGTFEKSLGLSNKINYVKGICPASLISDFTKFETCFEHWRGLLNDFAHSASRMIPPYLTVSPIEMNKLKENIEILP